MGRRVSFIIAMLIALPMCIMAKEPVKKSDILRKYVLEGKKHVTVVAHRGDWRNHPENSLAAFQECIDRGVDMIEIDLQLTSDSILVIMHDTKLDRTSTGKGLISHHTYDEISKMRLYAGHGAVATRNRIPTLKEVLELCKGKILINIDKGYDYFHQVQKLLEETGTTDQIIIKSSHPAEKVLKENKDVIDKVIYMPIINLDKPGAEKMLDDYLAIHPVAIECCFNTYDDTVERLLAKIRNSSTHIWINSLWASLNASHDDDRAIEENDMDGSWGWILNEGATLIQTDRPYELIDYLKSRKRR